MFLLVFSAQMSESSAILQNTRDDMTSLKEELLDHKQKLLESGKVFPILYFVTEVLLSGLISKY